MRDTFARLRGAGRGLLRVGASAAALALALVQPAAAQVDAAAAQPSSAAPPAPAEQLIDFVADTARYDEPSDTVTVTGHVELSREGWRLRADAVQWDRRSGVVMATGNVVLTNPQGDVTYGDSVTLSDSLRDGVIENLLVVLENGGRLVAQRGTRVENGNVVLDRAAYTPCAVEDADGCPREPSWQVRAEEVTYDQVAQRIRYRNARISLFGLPILPLPGLSHPAGAAAGNGLLLPNLRVDRVNGLEIALPYYLQLSPTSDLTLTPHVYSGAAPMAEAELRKVTVNGAWQLHGYATYSNRLSEGGTTDPTGALRGYLAGQAGFQFSPEWSFSASARIATDRTFLRRYDISRDDRLRSTFTVARHSADSYLTVQGWAVQTLRGTEAQGAQPLALPLIDYRRRFENAPLGGLLTVQANTLALTRSEGQDTQRAFVSALWERRAITTLGQDIRFSLLARGDLYHSSGNALTLIPDYRGSDGVQARAFAAGAVDVRWPLAGAVFGGQQRLTPRVQLAVVSPVDNVDIPNEDSRAFELEDGNIFALNRFPGYDRFEDGARITYGLEWAFNRPNLSVDAVIAQSFRLDDRPSLFAQGTGLRDTTSDIVGRTTVAYRNFVRLTHRFRLDDETLAVRRNEIDLTLGSRSTYVIIGYNRLNRDISGFGEDLRDREEVRFGARVRVARYWSVFGSAIIDLTDRAEDPLSAADGYTPVRHRIGLSYDDDCLSIGLTWRRDYLDRGDARAGNSFLLRLALRNLGV